MQIGYTCDYNADAKSFDMYCAHDEDIKRHSTTKNKGAIAKATDDHYHLIFQDGTITALRKFKNNGVKHCRLHYKVNQYTGEVTVQAVSPVRDDQKGQSFCNRQEDNIRECLVINVSH
jgi:hypothetical protein